MLARLLLAVALSFGVISCSQPSKEKMAPVKRSDPEKTNPAPVATELQLLPATGFVQKNQEKLVSAVGGEPPYIFAVASGPGTITPETNGTDAKYSPGNNLGPVLLEVMDSKGKTKQSQILVYDALSVAPNAVTLAVTNLAQFVPAGGVPPYVYSVTAGTGTVNSTGQYTAPGSTGSETVRVTDSLGTSVDATITVNPALAISTSAISLIVNDTHTFIASGGVTPYSWSVQSGSGTVDSNGVFTAPATSGTTVIRVTDSYSNFVESTVTINSIVIISPSSLVLAINNAHSFTALGGVPPYSFSVLSGVGSIDSATGAYNSGATSGSAVVRVTDSLGGTSDSVVTVNPALEISPATVSVAVNGTQNFSATGGVTPYSFTVLSGDGSINSSTGDFTAGSTGGTSIVRVTDSFGNNSDSTVTIIDDLTITPVTKTLAVNNTHTFVASGGQSPYTFSIFSGAGSINSSTGMFTAPGSAGSVTIRVTDAASATADAVVTVNPALTISPSALTLAVNNLDSFSASGGVAPYSYSIVSGGGSINPSTGAFTAASSAGAATVRVTDSLGNVSNASVTVNPALLISPSVITMGANTNQTFSGSGGVSPYTYSIQSGLGTISSVTGFYTAPALSGAAVIRIEDSRGNSSTANVTITGALAITPGSVTLAVNNGSTFSATGGVGPYVYSVASGGGSVNATTGVYTAPATSGVAVVRVTDAQGTQSDANITINPALAITPSSASIVINGSFTFSATGGVSPYSYTKISGGGSINSTTGAFTAPATIDSVVVRVTDSLGNSSDANITVTNSLVISPSSLTLSVNNTSTFSASGGQAPYVFSVASGGGTINSSSGEFTAPATAGAVTVRVTDNGGQTADATITINPALVISPASKSLAVTNSFTFSASGGVSPYTFSVQSGGGTINTSTGVYVAPVSAGASVVRVTDSLGNIADSNVTINPALSLSPSSVTLSVSNNTTFIASGGVGPYAYSLQSGAGSISSSTGVYTAPGVAGSAVALVTDSLGNTSTSSITINGPLAISPSTLSLAVNNNYTFSAAGGVGPYAYSIVSGGGSINSSTGAFTAPASSGSVTVRATDSLLNISDCVVTVNPALAINPSSASIAVSGNRTFNGVNGVAPYAFSVVSGGGSINASTGVYVAPASAGAAIVRVTDALLNTADSSVTIVPALAISPTLKTLSVGNTFTFAASGGLAPYTFSKFSGVGTVNSSTGLYTAPGSSGAAVVRVTDSLGSTANANVTVNPALSYSAANTTIAAGNILTTTASGGVSPYNYSVQSGGGSISGAGVYTSAGSGAVTLRVTDSLSNFADLNITVNEALSISPTGQIVAVNSNLVFTGAGGVPPYAFSVTGAGSIDVDTGDYTADASAGTDTVRITDSIGNIVDTTVNVFEPLVISPSTISLTVDANSTFTASGGFGGYTFQVFSGNGTIDSVTGDYTAPGGAGIDVVRVSDGAGNTADATVTIVAALAISPQNSFVGSNRRVAFSGIGGQPPYTFTILSGSGTLNSSTGAYVAPQSAGTVQVRITDALNATFDTDLTILEPQAVYAGGAHHCVKFTSGQVKCWGRNTNGQLGIGSTSSKGDNANEMGNNLPFVNLGSGKTAVSMALGESHTCALLNDGTVKCWGYNITGQLGYGNTTQLTAPPASTVSLGDTATAIYAGGSNTCALLTSGGLKCWGNNRRGQLGNGNTTYQPSPISVTITSGTPAISNVVIASETASTGTTSGGVHMCAHLSDGNVKCWGFGTNGNLGTGTAHLGDNAGEVTASLPAVVNFGGQTAVKIAANRSSTCALLSDSTVKCFGNAASGQLANGTTTGHIGDTAGELASSAAMLHGMSPAPNNIYAAGNSYCMTNSSGHLKCWGSNTSGLLGLGNSATVTAVGDTSTTEFQNSALTSLSSTLTPTTLTSSSGSAAGYCAILSNKDVKCWGNAANGRLGNSSTTTHLGDTSGEMGDSLNPMVFGGSL